MKTAFALGLGVLLAVSGSSFAAQRGASADAAPAGTPRGVVMKLNTEMKRYLELPATLKRFSTEGVEADFRTPDELHRMMPAEMAKWKNVAKVANIPVGR